MSLKKEKKHLREAATGLRSAAQAIREDEGETQLVRELEYIARDVDEILEHLENDL